MNILKAPASELLNAVLTVSGAVERRHAMPILGHVLITKAAEQLALTASDLELQLRVQTTLGAGTGHGLATAPVHKLVEILRALPAAQEIVLTSTPQRLTLLAGRSRFTLQALPAGDFPLQPQAHDLSTPFSLPQAVLRSLLEQVEFAMAVQDIRYYLNGLLFSTEGHTLRLVATDGNRLALAEATLPQALPTHAVILPRKAVHALQRHLRTPRGRGEAEVDEPQVSVEFSAQQARFLVPGAELLTKLVEGRFPDYTRVLPAAPRHHAVLNRAGLLGALQRVAVLTSDRFRGVRLGLDAGVLNLSAHNADQEEAEVELAAAYDGPSLAFGFNVGYLVDLLGKTDSEAVGLALQDERSPVLFSFADLPGFKYVVSPMRL